MDAFIDWFGYFLLAQALIELGVLALIFEFA
jgi:hypothetical protein